MGIFSRMSNILKGKANSAMDEVEMNNLPELLDVKIREMKEKLNQAKLSSAQILGNVHQNEKQLEQAKRESADYEEKVKKALAANNEDLAKRALTKKVESDKKIATLQQSYDTSKAQAEAIKKNLASLESEIKKAEDYRASAEARVATADAQMEVNKILSNTSTKAGDIQIDDIERKIQKKESLAQGLGELTETDTFESEFAALDEVDIDSELDKYR